MTLEEWRKEMEKFREWFDKWIKQSNMSK